MLGGAGDHRDVFVSVINSLLGGYEGTEVNLKGEDAITELQPYAGVARGRLGNTQPLVSGFYVVSMRFLTPHP